MLSIRRIGILGRAYRQFNRYRHILYILIKYGFGDLIDILNIEHYLEIGIHLISRKPVENVEKMTRAKRIRLVFEELGPTFIKLGQLLSTRSDLIPEDLGLELLKLQDQVPPVSYEAIRKIVKSELGRYPEEVFAQFGETPIAAASIGQVHKAVLPNAEEVAVKIQRPDIRKTIETDLEIMLHLATLLERNIEEFNVHHPTKIIEEFAISLEKEIDYIIEASHIERFARQFIGDDTIYVPKIFHDFSTERILTMEYIDGTKISEIDVLKREGYDLKKILKSVADSILKQIYIHGFFHADPHPANIFILPQNIVCFLDFGMMGRVSREERENFTDLTMRIIRGDAKQVVSSVLKHVSFEREPDRNQLEKDLSAMIDQHLYHPLKEIHIGRVLQQLITVTTKHRLSFKADLFLMMKSFSIVESLGESLDPDFDIIENATPFAKKVQRGRFSPKRLTEDMVFSGAEFLKFFMELPGELQDILNQAKQGKFKIEFEHHGLDPMLSSHDRISNRIVFAIVLAALIIGSSLVVHSGIPPKWHGIPIIGLSGYIVAAIMGFWLLLSILRRGKM
ncbi:MAG: AarF/ABC1/UbiB kinase family protein [Proteobacteria bacterium]|nr:AarF/ABC1/UbiB kinase family protein [Pseudomonadota bacterium]